MRNVLVIGGSRGLAILKKLSVAGYNIIAIARKESPELTTAIAASGSFNSNVLHLCRLILPKPIWSKPNPTHAVCTTPPFSVCKSEVLEK
jgi:NAD(P)-dependent dehydrogenase (short-subunit alcohol dehydrogenase family)